MAFRAICVALLLASLPSAGCGTVANLANSHPEEGGTTPFGGVKKDLSCLKNAGPFGGVKKDLSCLKNAGNGESACKPVPTSESEQYRQAALKLFCAADLPLSAIGDVVTWPYTATYTYINQPTPTTPVTLAPNYPVMQAPAYPAIQTTPAGGPQTSPLELLPNPKTLP
jgi:uncharacterized protein YceK